MQHGFLAIDDQGMPGIVPALKAHYTLSMVSEPVDDFTLALVTPLRTDYYDVLCHCRSLIFSFADLLRF
jgi:hypothetical protein